MRRTALLFVLAACAPKPVRPAPDVELVRTAGTTADHALLLFKHPSPLIQPRYHLAHHSLAGHVQWHRPIDPAIIVDADRPLRVFGDAALVPFSTSTLVTADALLHVRLDDGATTPISPQIHPGEPGSPIAIVGDDRHIFVAWAHEDRDTTLELAAITTTTGARAWTFTIEHYPVQDRLELALDTSRLLLAGPGPDWIALDRTTGARTPLPIADAASTMCRAAGSWWATRDDQFVTFDATTTRTAPATFIPPAFSHQWQLTACAETDDHDVLLAIEIEPSDTTTLVVVDRDTLAPTWQFDLPPMRRLRNTWSPHIADTILAEIDRQTCAISRKSKSLQWCAPWNHSVVLHDGPDFILAGTPAGNKSTDIHFLRIRGADGQISAATTLQSPALQPHEFPPLELSSGHLWLTMPEQGPYRPEQLPLFILDATTLQPTPKAPGRATDITTIDALPHLASLLPQTHAPNPSTFAQTWHDDLPPLHAVNPWDIVFLAPEPANTPTYDPAELLTTIRTNSAPLHAAEEVKLLAWCDSRFIAYARKGTTTTLIKSTVRITQPGMLILPGTDPQNPTQTAADRVPTANPGPLYTVTYDRPVTATDLDQFALSTEGNDRPTSPDLCTHRGTIDESAWSALVATPRTQIWQLR